MRLFSRLTPLVLTPTATVIFALAGTVFLCAGLIGLIVYYIAITILLIAQLVNLIRALYDFTSDKGKISRNFVAIIAAIALPILLVVNMRAIDYAGTYLVVRVTEQYVLRNVEVTSVKHSDQNSTFKYFRVSFGYMAGTKRWLIFDESDQVMLDYQKRNTEWWKVSKEFEESEGCATNGRRLYSHFYVQYYGC